MSDTVVVIGREANWKSSARNVLAERGLQVLTAVDPCEASGLVRHSGAGVLIVDVSGQEAGATETVRSVRAQFERLPSDMRPYIVAVGHRADAAAPPDGSEDRADAFLFQPVPSHTLVSTVESFAITVEGRRSMLPLMIGQPA